MQRTVSDTFIDAMRRKMPPGRDLREVPQGRARPAAKPISVYARKYADRDSAITAAYARGGHTMKDIGDYFGLHYSRISKIVRNVEPGKKKDLTTRFASKKQSVTVRLDSDVLEWFRARLTRALIHPEIPAKVFNT